MPKIINQHFNSMINLQPNIMFSDDCIEDDLICSAYTNGICANSNKPCDCCSSTYQDVAD